MDINFFFLNWKMRGLWKGVFSSGDEVLDVGCGDEPNYHRYIKGHIVGVDKSKTSTVKVVADGHALPFKSSSFEGVVSVNSLYYYEDPKKAVEEFARVLKKKGRMVLITPFNYPIHDIPHDKCRFTEFGIRELFEGEFIIERVVPVGGLFSIPAVACRSIAKGSILAAPIPLKPIVKIVVCVVFLIPSIVAALVGALDALDRTRRWPTYYFTVARKK